MRSRCTKGERSLGRAVDVPQTMAHPMVLYKDLVQEQLPKAGPYHVVDCSMTVECNAEYVTEVGPLVTQVVSSAEDSQPGSAAAKCCTAAPQPLISRKHAEAYVWELNAT